MDISNYLTDDSEPEPHALEGDAKVWIRRITPKRYDEISQKHTRTKVRGSRAVERTDDRAVTHTLLDESIMRWDNIEAGNGPLECSRENKIQLYGYWPLFRRVWNEAILGQLGLNDELEEAIEGN